MITLTKYKNKNMAVVGLGKTGMASARSLGNGGAHVFAWDDNEQGRQKLALENYPNVVIEHPDKYNWNEIDQLVLSAGIPLTHPEPHYAAKLANKAGCKIVCDIELLYNQVPEAKYIGITGTNGKSTTTSLIGHIVNSAGIDSQTGGNLGISGLDFKQLDGNGIYVIEMSSYQLDLIDKTHFNTTILLNITPDHLDRHGDMAGYIKAKSHIYKNQNKNDFNIIGIDCDNARSVFEKLQGNSPAKLIPISTYKKVAGGVAVIDGVIYNDIDGAQKELHLGFLKRLAGVHNAQNIAAAYAAAYVNNIADDIIINAIKTFSGLPHRMQYITEYKGVTFINDSKATNAEAAAKALASYDNIYWIAGGLSKEGGINSLGGFFSKIKHAYLIGKAQDEFAQTLDGKVKYSKCNDLSEAFKQSADDAVKSGKGVVLLSPACASWDQWPNFEVRGEAFCKMVEEMAG